MPLDVQSYTACRDPVYNNLCKTLLRNRYGNNISHRTAEDSLVGTVEDITHPAFMNELWWGNNNIQRGPALLRSTGLPTTAASASSL